MLLKRHVQLRPRSLSASARSHVAHHANDGHPFVRIEAAHNLPAKRILSGEAAPCQRGTDHRYKGCVKLIALVERAACHQRNSEGREVALAGEAESGVL